MPESSCNPQHTTAEALNRALEIYLNYPGGEPRVVALLHADIAEKALTDRGWHQRRRRGARGGPWVSPSGHCEGHTDHAFQLAVTADTLDPAATEDRDDEQRLRDLVTTVLEHDRPDDGADEIVIERIVPTPHGQPVVDAASRAPPGHYHARRRPHPALARPRRPPHRRHQRRQHQQQPSTPERALAPTPQHRRDPSP